MSLACTVLLALLPAMHSSEGTVTTDAYAFKMPWQLSGPVKDACVSVENVHDRHAEMAEVLSELVAQPFFRIFKVNLARECRCRTVAVGRAAQLAGGAPT